MGPFGIETGLEDITSVIGDININQFAMQVHGVLKDRIDYYVVSDELRDQKLRDMGR